MELVFGALAPKLSEQLQRTGKQITHFQKDADAITRLAIRGIISSSTAHAARGMLVKQIMRELAGKS